MKLFIVTAVLEVGAGVALMFFPSTTVVLLLGSPLDTPAALTLGRVAGAALLALGIANGFAHYDAQSRAARGLVSAMVLYNLGAVVILGAAGTWSRPVGIALWPAVVLHAAMAVWCIACLRNGHNLTEAESAGKYATSGRADLPRRSILGDV